MVWIDSFMQATVIMCLGMAIVFAFVATLVVLIEVSSRVLAKHIAAEPGPALAAPPPASEGAIVAAIAAALRAHSASRKQSKP